MNTTAPNLIKRLNKFVMFHKQPLALILAAGKSSRFEPFSDCASHKSMLRLCGKPILEHTLEAVARAGLKEVIIVTSRASTEIKDYFQDGKKLKLSIRYAEQPKPQGAGNAILCASDLIKQPFFVLHTNHVNADEFIKPMLEAKTRHFDAVLLGKKTTQVWKYGIYQLDKDRITCIIEKPGLQDAPSDIRVVGIYLLGSDFIKTLQQTPAQEYQLEEALNSYVKEKRVRLLLTRKSTLSLKFAWDIFPILDHLLSRISSSISKKADIHPTALIEGAVHIEPEARVYEQAIIKGPAYIGEGVVIGSGAIVRDRVCCEPGVKLGARIEVKNSLFMENAHTHSGFIGNSIIGREVRIGAGFITANRRFDRKAVSTHIKTQLTETGLSSLGAMIGHNAHIGIQVGTMPGVIIGAESFIYPGRIVKKNIPAGSRFPESE